MSAASAGTGASPPQPGAFSAWWQAARPRTLTVSVVPVVVGTASVLGQLPLSMGRAAAAAGTALLLQLATNWINDYADFERGADGSDRLGPPRAAAQGWITPAALRRGAALALAAAGALGVGLSAVAGFELLIPGALALLGAWAYTAGPWPLGYHGLGDLAVFAFFGLFAVIGSAYVQTGGVEPLAVAAAVPVGALATLVLAINNLRDLPTDARVGKRTLAVRLGDAGARHYAVSLVVLAYLGLGGLLAAGGGWSVALPLASLPLAVALVRRLRRDEGMALNPALGEAARLQLAFATLLVLGFTIRFAAA